jgi:hypothetical protein
MGYHLVYKYNTSTQLPIQNWGLLLARVYGQHTNHAVYGGARYNASDAAGQTSAGGWLDRCRRVELAKDL